MADRIDLLPRNQIVALADIIAATPRLSAQYSSEELLKINNLAAAERALKSSPAAKLHQLPVSAALSTPAVLKLRDLTYPLDKLVVEARKATDGFFAAKRRAHLAGPPRHDPIVERGTATVAKVSKRLNARGLGDAERLLLALPTVYEYLLLAALDKQKVADDDDEGLADAVLRSVVEEPKRYLLMEIVGRVLKDENIRLDDKEDKETLATLAELTAERGLSLRNGAVRPAVLKLVNEGRNLGRLRYFVDRYALNGELDLELFTEAVRREMARFLQARGLKIRDELAFDSGEYDEHFAIAFDHAMQVDEGSADPVDVARTKGGVIDWDFKIRRISESDRPIIRREAILAAGALYTTFVEGEQMRVFDIADKLLTQWHMGELDIPDGDTASLLNRYEILMRDRPTEEERAMHYRRVFSLGNAETLSGTVVNEAFPALWDNMMYEATRHIAKVERYFTEGKFISRTSLYRAIRDLQYNLSEFMTGSAPKKTHEMYNHLSEALDIIGSEDVLNHIGGRRKSILLAIQEIGKRGLKVAIPANTLVDIAEQGNQIFAFIADFEPENVADDQFEAFLDACKAVIVAQAALEPGGKADETDSGPSDSDEDDYGPSGGRRRRQDGYAEMNRTGHSNGNGRPVGAGARQGGGGFDDWEA
jgi:hypothetical protein